MGMGAWGTSPRYTSERLEHTRLPTTYYQPLTTYHCLILLATHPARLLERLEHSRHGVGHADEHSAPLPVVAERHKGGGAWLGFGVWG